MTVFSGTCIGGPYDGQAQNFVMKHEGVFIPGIPGERESKMLGWYNLNDDKWIWEEYREKDDGRK